MPRIRCRFYTDEGAPINGGCKRQNDGTCDFVHPSHPLWDSAPPPRVKYNQSGPSAGAGRGRGGAPGGSWGGASTGGTDDAWVGSAVTAGTGVNKGVADQGWGNPPRGTRALSTAESSSSSVWGNPSVADSTWGEPAPAYREPTAHAQTQQATSGWGEPSDAQSKPAASRWRSPSPASVWGAPPGWGSPSARTPPAEDRADVPASSGWDDSSTWDKGKGVDRTGNADVWGASSHKPAASSNGWGSPPRTRPKPSMPVAQTEPSPQLLLPWDGPSKVSAPVIIPDNKPVEKDIFKSPVTPFTPFQQTFDLTDWGIPDPTMGSPAPSSAGASTHTPKIADDKEYMKVLAEAVRLQHELSEAEKERVRLKNLQNSKQFAQAPQGVREKLEGLRQTHEIKLAKIKKEHDEVLAKLAARPLPGTGQDGATTLAELRADATEVQQQLATLRQHVSSLGEPAASFGLAPSLKRRAPDPDPDTDADASEAEDAEAPSMLEARIEQTEEKLEELEDYVQQRAQSDRALFEERADVLVPSDPPPPPPVPAEVTEKLKDYWSTVGEHKASLADSQEKVAWLAERLAEAQRVIAENAALKAELRLAAVEDEHARNQERIEEMQAGLAELHNKYEMLAARAPPAITAEEIVAQLHPRIVPQMREDVLQMMLNIRAGVEQYLRRQQDEAYRAVGMGTVIQPALKVVQCVQQYVDTTDGVPGRD